MKKLIKWGIVILIIFVVIGAITGGSSKEGNKAIQAGLEAGKGRGTTNTPAASKPKISVNGKVAPSLAKKGDKVVVEFEIENLDDKTTVDGMRILFANQDFVNKALVITGVMSGGVQQGRAFEWTNELMAIKPKEKRNFVIVAAANQPGNYESEVTFVSPVGKVAFDDQDQSLKAKVAILP